MQKGSKAFFNFGLIAKYTHNLLFLCQWRFAVSATGILYAKNYVLGNLPDKLPL